MSGHRRTPGGEPCGGELAATTVVPQWAAPATVGALFTTRRGGVSDGRWSDADGGGGLNLGANCGDDPQRVAHNRELIAAAIGVPISWLAQVHGTRVIEVDEAFAAAGSGAGRAGTAGTAAGAVEADAQVTTVAGIGLGMLVADCLPVLLADRGGSIVGIAHAGWRGLAGGVLENTIATMRARRPAADLVAWLGPCIGAQAFEVGEDVLNAFVRGDPGAAAQFKPGRQAGKWWADLRGLAGRRLARAGISSVAALGACTVADGGRFWSYRRDGICGRMAGLIWLRR